MCCHLVTFASTAAAFALADFFFADRHTTTCDYSHDWCCMTVLQRGQI